MRPHILLLALPSANAFQLPFNFPLLFKSTPAVLASVEVEVEVEPQIPLTPRVAIIGAGAGGSSAAFWIGKAKERFGLDVEIDVYEKEGYIGGREYRCFLTFSSWASFWYATPPSNTVGEARNARTSSPLTHIIPKLISNTGSTIVYPHDNKTLSPLELGASIFVQANKNMMRAAEEFNFDLNAFEDEGNSIGIWDGQKIRFTVSTCPIRAYEVFLTRICNSITVVGGTRESSSGDTATKHHLVHRPCKYQSSFMFHQPN